MDPDKTVRDEHVPSGSTLFAYTCIAIWMLRAARVKVNKQFEKLVSVYLYWPLYTYFQNMLWRNMGIHIL